MNGSMVELDIQEVASELDLGLVVYVHKETKEIESLPHEDEWDVIDIECWQETIDKVENNKNQYWRFEKMSSRESFKVMARFADQLPDIPLKFRLHQALNQRKPFSKFRNLIDNSAYREIWFEFRDNAYKTFVIAQAQMILAEEQGIFYFLLISGMRFPHKNAIFKSTSQR